jgi:hypothetical protein
MKTYQNVEDYLISKLTERHEEVSTHICTGRLANFEEFRALCGFMDGLKYAVELVKDLQKRQEQDADE